MLSSKQQTKKNSNALKSWISLVNNERKEAVNTLFTILQDKGTPQPVVSHASSVIAKELCFNRQQKLRETIQIKVESLLRMHDKKNKKCTVELISCIFENEDVYHQKNFVKSCIEFLVTLLESSCNQPIFQLKILSTAITNLLRFIVSNQFMLESLHNSLNFIKSKCQNQIMLKNQVISNTEVTDKIEEL